MSSTDGPRVALGAWAEGLRRPGPVGLITGSGTYALEGLADARPESVVTEFGPADITMGRLHGIEVAHVSRHGDGHPRLSHQVAHRANLAALAEIGVGCVVGMTICGAVDPALELGDLVVFDDVYFPSNRLPDGSLCTFFVEPGDPRRAHWIFDRPYAEPLRRALLGGATAAGRRVRDGGAYGHVDGPRFNTAAEIGALRAFGVTAVSQTGGPETVLAGEAGIPFALLGYVTDWANGAGPEVTTVKQLVHNMVASHESFGAVLAGALPALAISSHRSPGERYGFERTPEPFRASGPRGAMGHNGTGARLTSGAGDAGLKRSGDMQGQDHRD